MHGRKRDTRPPTEEEKAEKAKKIAKYNKLKAAILDRNSRKVYDEVGNQVSAALAALNPDFYTLFNYRRDLLNTYFDAGKDKAALCVSECRLVEQGLARNPKSYGCWSHREWIIDQATTDFEEELSLCTKFLKMDARNFHCWNYRRVVVKRIGTRACMQSELEYTREKINENFSNYSAWHYRSVLIPQLNEGVPAEVMDGVLDAEFELVKQAFYTEPEDQSAWLYHRWLLGRVSSTGLKLPCVGISLGITHELDRLSLEEPVAKKEEENDGESKPEGEARAKRQLHVFERELATCSELLEVEPDCKWVLLTVALLLGGVDACREGASDPAIVEQIKTHFAKLEALDPMRRNYYASVRQKLMQVMSSST